MINQNLLFLLITTLFTSITFCQNETDENFKKIGTVLDNYFDLDREVIHLHLNKTTFINNETIWFQGYIFNRKTNKPYFTTNVFVLLYDETGKQVHEKLVYASNGIFSSNILLNSNLKSGKYYIQVYTNWMNNFAENESTITEINIINPSEGIKNYKKIDAESLAVFLNPEGKSLINGISNTIGIQVTDCKGNSPQDLEVTIINGEGEVIKSIKLNQFGYGKFDIIPTNNNIKVILNYDNKTIEKNLQIPDLIGISIEANSFSIENKIVLKIKTNEKSYDTFLSKKLNLVIHQDQKVSIFPITFSPNKLEQLFSINKEDLNEGINTIRIIDDESKQWSERLIYINPNYSDYINVLKNKRNEDKINLIGYSQSSNALLSISILPKETKSFEESINIIAGITINPYISNSLTNSNYYLNDQNRQKLYELDLVLLNEEKSKYSWEYMKIHPPVSKYSFDTGITLKGKIIDSIKNKTLHKIKLLSYKELIMTMSDVSEKGEYLFENLLLIDSTLVNLSVQKLPNFEDISVKLIPEVINRKRFYNKPFSDLVKKNCNENFVYENSIDLEIPQFDDKTINLEEVVLKGKKKESLTRSNILSNTFLRGFKIDQTANRVSLLNFIEQNGFTVIRDLGNIQIKSRQKNSLNLPDPIPLVYINDRQLFSSFDELEFLQMIEIDEIYIDPRAIVASMNNNAGIIKIYTKMPKNNYSTKPNKNSYLIKEAFSLPVSFKNSEYKNTQNKGFDNYGLISWSPNIKSNDKGDFIFEFIDLNKSKYKIIIEGITSEGKLIHEEKTIE